MKLLKDLQGHPEWQGMLRAAEKMMPEIPEWNPNLPDAPNEWIYKSGMRAGFELCLQIFQPDFRRK